MNLACVHISELPLQLLLHRHPDWRSQAAAVVDADKAQGVLLWVNEVARACHIQPGMRYAAALSLDRGFRAGTVTDSEIQQCLKRISEHLHLFAPRVESAKGHPGLFHLDVRGFDWNRQAPQVWVHELHQSIWQSGFESRIALGFRRFGSFAATVRPPALQVFAHPEEEQACLRSTPLERLALPPRLRDALSKLGIHELGGFLDLPRDSLRRRFGKEAEELHRRAFGDEPGFEADPPPCPPGERLLEFEYGEHDLDRLVYHLEPLFDALLNELGGRQEALAALRLLIELEDHRRLRTVLSPARPSLDRDELLKLLRLRLETLEFSAAVAEVRLQVRGCPAGTRQFELWRQRSQRSTSDAEQVFAELRAEWGNDAVEKALLQDCHLPEAQVRWQSMRQLPTAFPRKPEAQVLIRSLYAQPHAIAPLSSDAGCIGPHLISGGWWGREQQRAYYYQPGPDGSWRWLYQDQHSKRWFEHATIT